MKPKKHLGQHFLRDQNIARKICDRLPAAPEEAVVEIGPGLGALTVFLLERWPGLLAVEFDPEAAAQLQMRFAGSGLRIVNENFLDWDPAQNLNGEAWFIGNLPYNISSQIFFHLIHHRDRVKGGVFMVQREVAERIASGPGNKDYGILSVLLGYYFEIRKGFNVPPQVFSPPPKVQSAVFSIARKPATQRVPWEVFSFVVKKAFNQRRKTLRNALKGLNFAPDGAAMLDRRAEQLSIGEFETLSLALLPESNDEP